MIAEPGTGQYFIYRHIRLDTNEVFYIGMGKVPPPHKVNGYRTRYTRAFETAKRSYHWKEVVKETWHEVEIILETNDEGFAKQKEMEFIALYGRKSVEGGTLVNIGAGGDDLGANLPKTRPIPIEQLDLNGNVIKVWAQPMDIEEQTGYLRTNIVKCCRKKQVTAYGYQWRYKDNCEFDHIQATTSRRPNARITTKGLKVVDRETGMIYKSIAQAAIALGIGKHILYTNTKNRFIVQANKNYNPVSKKYQKAYNKRKSL